MFYHLSIFRLFSLPYCHKQEVQSFSFLLILPILFFFLFIPTASKQASGDLKMQKYLANVYKPGLLIYSLVK